MGSYHSQRIWFEETKTCFLPILRGIDIKKITFVSQNMGLIAENRLFQAKDKIFASNYFFSEI